MTQRITIATVGAWGFLVTFAWIGTLVNVGSVLNDASNAGAHVHAVAFGLFAGIANSVPLIVALAVHCSGALDRLPHDEQQLVRRYALFNTVVVGHAFLALFIFTVDRVHTGAAAWMLIAALLVCTGNAVTCAHACLLAYRLRRHAVAERRSVF